MQLDLHCTPRLDVHGTERCLPHPQTGYLDAACTRPISHLPPETNGLRTGSFVVQETSPQTSCDEARYRVFRAGAPVPSGRAIYYRPDGKCNEVSTDATGADWFEAGEEAAPSTFVELSQLELASVLAFRRLARELKALGAPAQLAARARAAARDEVRHARSLGRLARAYGVAPRPLRIEVSPLRDLLALALDNASEGCVRELFGALVAHVQKERATDPHIAAAFREIADDEARHAALALDLDTYVSPLLAPEQRAQLAGARKRALHALYDELAEPSADERLSCGMPSLQEARVLFETLRLPMAEGAGLGGLPS